MRYNWDVEDLLQQINLLKEMINNERDLDRKLYLQKVLDSSEYIIFETFGDYKSPTVSARQRLFNIESERIGYRRYYSLISDFYSELAPIRESIHEVEDIIESMLGEDFDLAQITGSYVTNDKALSLVNSFYSEFDSVLYPFFRETFDVRETTLRFDKKFKFSDKSSDGTTIFIDGVRKNFINAYRTKNAEKIFTLIHEYGHAIRNLFNPERSVSNDDGVFEEVDGLFPELVALHENVGNLDPLYIAFLKYTTFIDYYEKADCLLLHNVILNAFHDNGNKLNKALFDTLEEDYSIDDEMWETILDTTLFEEGVYVISYLVAMELLHIYKKDKNKALELYREFLSLPSNQDLLPFVVKLVKINGNILAEAKAVVDEMKLQLERYGGKHV